MDLATPAAAVASLHRKGLLTSEDVSALETALDSLSSDIEYLSFVRRKAHELCAAQQWELIACGLLLATAAMHHSSGEGAQLPATFTSLVRHEEPRIRTLAAALLGAYAARVGSAAFTEFEPLLVDNIRAHFSRPSEKQHAVLGGTEIAVDDTTGWSSLETSIIALTRILQGCGRQLLEQNLISDELLDLCINQSCKHVNRHIRQATCGFVNTLLELKDEHHPTDPLIERCAPVLALCAQDNWSQVRYAACIPIRTMLMRIPEQERESLWPLLVPRLCLNRYYIADGVKLYSQETWRMVFGDQGRKVVAKYAKEVTEYYAAMVAMDNHIVRESACFAIAELASKIDKEAIRPHIPGMLQTMLVCFDDDSWPVRDAASVSTGRFVKAHPDQSAELLESLFDRWFNNAHDPIWSVRENAAIALGDVMDSEHPLAQDAVNRVEAFINEHLLDVLKQEPSGPRQRRHSGSGKNVHTDQTMYSCGSLAPKLKKGGCSDCHVSRSSEPWEHSDGCVYLIRELGQRKPEMIEKYMPNIVQLLRADHFGDAAYLHTTVWKQLPAIAKAIGKRPFKRYLDDYFPSLHTHLSASGAGEELRWAAAMDFVAAVKQFVGEGIFEGRVPEEFRSVILAGAH